MPCFGWGVYWWIWPLVMLATVVIILMLVRRACWSADRGGTPFGGCCWGWKHAGGETALEALKRRYARGELTKEEFEAMKRDLAG